MGWNGVSSLTQQSVTRFPGPYFVDGAAGRALSGMMPFRGTDLGPECQRLADTAVVAGEELDCLGVLPVFQRIGATASAGELFCLRIDGDPLKARPRQQFKRLARATLHGGQLPRIVGPTRNAP